MNFYFICIRPKDDGYLTPKLTDDNNLENAYNVAKLAYPDGAVSVYKAVLDRNSYWYTIGEEIIM